MCVLPYNASPKCTFWTSRKVMKDHKTVHISDESSQHRHSSVDVNARCSSNHADDSDTSMISSNFEELESTDESNNDESVERLSDYEVKRLERIARNKRKFEEIFGQGKQQCKEKIKKARKDTKVIFCEVCMC